MIPHLDDRKTGGAPRGMPRRRVPRRRLLALGLVAGLALIQAGCQSGPLSGCGSCNSCGFLEADDRVASSTATGLLRLGDRRRRGRGRLRRAVDGGRAGDDGRARCIRRAGIRLGPLDRAVPDTPSTLDPVPKAQAVPCPGSSSTSGSGAAKTSTFTRPSSTSDRGPTRRGLDRPVRFLDLRPASSRRRRREDDPGTTTIPLDHLPPLGLPGEVTMRRRRPRPLRPPSRGGSPGSIPAW